MTMHITKDLWLDGLESSESRHFFSELIELLASQGIFPSLTKAGYFGIPVSKVWNRRTIKVHLSDTYQAHKGLGFARDTLRLGYGQDTPPEIMRVLDPWIDELHAKYSGEPSGKMARYEAWAIPDALFSARDIAESIEDASRRIQLVSSAQAA